MANAAAKKAAAAREAAASTYFPIIIALNIIYLSLRLFFYQSNESNPFSPYNLSATVSLISLSFLSYQGILADHANTMSSSKVGNGKGSEALAGGASLDLLGLVILVQFGTIFISEKLYWLLGLLPLWGGWKIYSTFFGSKGAGGAGGVGGFMSNNDNQVESSGGGSADDKMTAEKLNEKRQKRAERRRQKWS